MSKLAPYRKAITAVIGFIVAVAAAGLLPAEALPYVNSLVAAATAVGVYVLPNAGVDSAKE